MIKQYSICTYYKVFPKEVHDPKNGENFYYLGEIPNKPAFSLVVEIKTGLTMQVLTTNLTTL